MQRATAALATSFLALAFSISATRADIAYDNITNNPGRLVFISSDDEFADDTTIDPIAGMMISAVRARLYNASNNPYTGELRIWLYRDASGVPGSLLGAATTTITLASRTEGTFEVAFPNLVAPTVNLWTGYQVQIVGPQAQVGILEDNYPSIGQSSDRLARHYPDGSWGLSEVPDSNMLFQIVTVPSPTVAAALLLFSTALTSRRRRTAHIHSSAVNASSP